MGSLVERQGGWERVCAMLPQHHGASSASASAPMRRDKMLTSSSLLETRVGAVSVTENRGNQCFLQRVVLT